MSRDIPPPHSLRRSYASIALASGTGEYVAALQERGKKQRWAWDMRSVLAFGTLCIAGILVALWLSWGEKGSEANDAGIDVDSGQETRQSSHSQDSAEKGEKEEMPAGATTITIYISGQVNKPGVYTVAKDARVNTVVEQAGGLTNDAAQYAINLAAPMKDGEHVHIPHKNDVSSGSIPFKQANSGGGSVAGGAQDGGQGGNMNSGGGEKQGGKNGSNININTASQAELETLPGVGPATANDIVQWRQSHGQFKTPSDLMKIPGIGKAKFEKIRSRITV
ncbi:ComEA family DNA-binding protein [Actinotignum urinale]|uniref:ComEA family DNA-binding protein n=1 Tax=Actinotignum urinale TaxID=190146 RepID=UPI0015E06538|nr:ComEA family DNA-binding protein [Actinotignum urinale]WIK58885.1 ComEA family DNA-binding protein [Actinotignum urinale]